MKLHNDQITSSDFNKMNDALKIAQAKIERALSYGEHMRSSRLLNMEDAVQVLTQTLKEIGA